MGHGNGILDRSRLDPHEHVSWYTTPAPSNS